MGSPLSPVIANLYMEYFETEIIRPIKTKGMTWMRYVDDILTFWNPVWGDFSIFLNKLNNLVPSINFKVEWENNNKIPFLDVLIIRDPSGYKFTVYRKPTFSISYIHFFSYHDTSVKISIASNLFLCALRICSSYLDSEINTVREQLKSLRYPDYIIEKAIYKANQIFYRPAHPKPENLYTNKIKIPYIQSIKSMADPLGKQNPFVFNYPNTIGSAVVNVYQKNRDNRDVGVYSIPCNDCGKPYLGYTNKGLPQRLIQHKRSVRYGQQNSAVFKHVSKENHTMNWNAAQVIYRSSCRFKSQIIEAAAINSFDNINIHKGAWKPDKVDDVFIKPIIKGIKNHFFRPGVT